MANPSLIASVVADTAIPLNAVRSRHKLAIWWFVSYESGVHLSVNWWVHQQVKVLLGTNVSFMDADPLIICRNSQNRKQSNRCLLWILVSILIDPIFMWVCHVLYDLGFINHSKAFFIGIWTPLPAQKIHSSLREPPADHMQTFHHLKPFALHAGEGLLSWDSPNLWAYILETTFLKLGQGLVSMPSPILNTFTMMLDCRCVWKYWFVSPSSIALHLIWPSELIASDFTIWIDCTGLPTQHGWSNANNAHQNWTVSKSQKLAARTRTSGDQVEYPQTHKLYRLRNSFEALPGFHGADQGWAWESRKSVKAVR